MTRGRTSADRDRIRGRKPKPPGHLTPAEAAIWTKLCSGQDNAWCELAATGSLLERYCIARSYFDLLVGLRRRMLAIPEEEGNPAPDLTASFGISEEIIKQSAEVLRLERALRLTPQSRQEPKGTRNEAPAPWDMVPEDDGDTA